MRRYFPYVQSFTHCFVCAADCGSFNKAAEKLYLSAPSVMKQVNALEKQLDMKLFHRTNQGLHLTPAGQVIYRHAKYLFLIPGMPSRKPVPLPAFLKNVLYRKFSSQSVQTFYGSVVQSKCFVSGLPAAHCSF